MFIEKILTYFPRPRLSFAYGSGIFQQLNQSDPSKNLLDLIFVTDDPLEWHADNLRMNKDHYSFLRFVGPKRLAYIQENFGASVYYNTLVKLPNKRYVKYGVISTKSLINDLLDWETLYISGRLHKPVRFLLDDLPGTQLHRALKTNSQSAVHSALLLLPEEFTEEKLYSKIAGLSYNGDFRMSIGAEDRNKISNIVKPNILHFRKIYENTLNNLVQQRHLGWDRTKDRLEQDLSPQSLYHHLSLLPKCPMFAIVKHFYKNDSRHSDTEELLRSLSHDIHYRDIFRENLAHIVKKSSWNQSLKGLFTAGLLKSLKYGRKKVDKYLVSTSRENKDGLTKL